MILSLGIVVFDSASERTWRVAHPYMFPDPDFAAYRVRFA